MIWNNTPFPGLVLKSILFILLLSSVSDSLAQKDSTLKNTVRFNVTNPLIFGSSSLIFGYERMVREHQSFSINIGSASYPALVYDHSDTVLILHRTAYKDQGFHVSGDYRFYLKEENKYPSPRGLYMGPYYSYNYFKRTNNWTINSNDFSGDLQSDLILNVHTIGVQLGYQFVFWNRLSVDLLMLGPGIGIYTLKADLNTNLSEEDQQLFFDALNDYLSEKIPGYDRVIDAGDFKNTGSVRTADLGFRYMVMVGFRF